ncbi:uncharacterized protein F4822DRAFT_424223 [Hypoxylon trugodes]|uniref:uncharacterized protein n=1 Tax=Hypoxylon trugodes TaxID=326681 RepID=UPI00219ED0FA|nr:uncharacterized protein F4822DRAFT_424223 [Hypoxylon trugodes]KAI1393760.1 hypothetical protein F4822DRAFT_424223 [Hypoxylon trugodes]
MVQDINQPRDHFPHRSSYWPQERFPMEPVPDESRFTEPQPQDIRRPPMAIDKALREYCNISAEFYVLIPVIEGKPHIFTAPNIPSINISRFLDVEALSRELQRAQTAAAQPSHAEEFAAFEEMNRLDNARRWTQDRRYGQPMSLTNFEDDGNYKARKRPRATIMRREPETFEDEPASSSSSSKRGITIRDEKAVRQFYEERFKGIQQNACKLMSKAWVKAVEPKKQSTHPYTGADEKAPDWWPKPWGPSKEQRVRHKEPDHLYKRERIYLLIHILRMIVEPNHLQHPSVQKLYLNVSKLEEVTNEALSSFFTDKDNPNNGAKKPYLKEIFKVARFEERYKDGQIDGSTIVYVMPNDRVAQGYLSDTEDVTPGREDGEHNPTPTSSSASPQRTNLSQPIMGHNHSTDQSPTTQIPSEAFVGEMPVRGAQYAQSVLPPDMTAERQTYVDPAASMSSQPPLHPPPPANLGLHDMYTSPHDASRRSSMFTTPSDYTNPATPTLYQQWQHPGSTAPSNQSVYAFPQTNSAPQSFVGHPGVQMQHSQQYMSASFDGLPRTSHDAQHSILRALPQPNYHGYITHEPGPLTGPKTEPLPRHPTQ